MENFSSIIQTFALSVVPFLFAVTIHELMHGYVAYRLGDPTAKSLGRLTLNPISHIDIFGLLFLLVTQMFGWAKPVPVNFNMLKHKYGVALVSIAGPLSNFTLAMISAFLLKSFIYLVELINIPDNIATPISLMMVYSVKINIALFVLNLLPILPLDGGRILNNFLPRNVSYQYEQTERYGFIILLLLFISGVINYILYPPIRVLNSFIFNMIGV